jgi:hypothetical protein
MLEEVDSRLFSGSLSARIRSHGMFEQPWEVYRKSECSNRSSGCADEGGREIEGMFVDVWRTARTDGVCISTRNQGDGKGKIVEVNVDGIPDIARDFKICVQQALRDIDVPLPLLLRMRDLKEAMEKDQAGVEQRKYMGMPGAVTMGSSPLVVAVVGIAFAELALQAAGYTFLFAIGVTLVHELAENEWKVKCIAHYEACILAGGQYKSGNTWNQSRCGICMDRCQIDHEWPLHVGGDSCKYWSGK